MRIFFCATSLFITAVFSLPAVAQSGGGSTYAFLKLNAGAHAAALGGNAIATLTNDLTLITQSPSLLRASMHNEVALNFNGASSGIKFGDVIYARDYKKPGIFAADLHYISYGKFDRTDDTGEKTGEFNAGEYALSINWSRPLDSTLYIGAALKGILSDLGDYKSSGLAADAGLTWQSRYTQWTATVVAKNMGLQLTTYNNQREDIPFEIQAGISKQLAKAPFRLSLIGQQLQRFDLTYKDPSKNTIDPLTGNPVDNKITYFDKLTRHLIVNAEILFSKNFNVRLGYNMLKRKELAFAQKRSVAGFTGGLGIKINKFSLSYAYSPYNVAGSSNYFSVSVKLSDFAGR